jgi:hypothetical protein
MAKKKHKKHKHRFRNAGPRNVAPARNITPRTPRSAKQPDETPLRRLGFTAAGAAGTALVGSFLSSQGWAPKTIAGALSAVGAGLAWRGDDPTIRSIGAGTMSAAGSQLALMLIDDRGRKVAPAAPATAVRKPANADELPPGALENALERARQRLALASSELPDATV